MNKHLKLNNIILVGRRFEEYNQMFNLCELDLEKEKILDMGAGISSFGVEANKIGYNIISSDKIYSLDVKKLEKKCKVDLDIICSKLENVKNQYIWKFFANIEKLKNYRNKTYELFIKDFKYNEYGKYITETLPLTTFKDNTFSVSLVSHLLFMYDNHLDYEFHKQSILELMRITSKEIRIFPLVNLEYKISSFVEKILNDPDIKAKEIIIKKSHYEFVKGGNELMVIKI
ncbi:MAG: hypothetical protein GY830_08885 [Bacteroidetes bacterium]|nr:hypothetical protein [Bacteroidota bacterium]